MKKLLTSLAFLIITLNGFSQAIGSYPPYTFTEFDKCYLGLYDSTHTYNVASHTYKWSLAKLKAYMNTSGYLLNTRTLTINGTTFDLSANRAWSVGTVTSIATSTGITGGTITSTGTLKADTGLLSTHYYTNSRGFVTGNIYTTDGSLSGNRVATLNGHTLTFSGTSGVGIGITPTSIFQVGDGTGGKILDIGIGATQLILTNGAGNEFLRVASQDVLSGDISGAGYFHVNENIWEYKDQTTTEWAFQDRSANIMYIRSDLGGTIGKTLFLDGASRKQHFGDVENADIGVKIICDQHDGTYLSLIGNTSEDGWRIDNNAVLFPITDGQNIGISGTNRIGTIYMSSNIDFPTTMNLTVSGSPVFTWNNTGKVTLGEWNGTAIADAYISSASTWNAKQNALGFTPLNPANNLNDVLSASSARSNLGLGTLATQSGTFSGTSSGTNTGDQTISDATISLTDVTTNNVSTSAHGFFPKLTIDRLYYVNHSGVLTALAFGTSGKVLTTNGATSDPTWETPASGSLTVGTTAIASGATTRILYDNAGTLGEYTVTGSGTEVALSNSPTFVTPTLGTVNSGNLVNCTGYLNKGVGTPIVWTWDGQGTTVTTGNTRYFVMPYAGTITGWSIVEIGTSPTCTIDVWKVASGTSLPTVSNTIMGTKPALSSGNAVRSTTLTGWSPTTFSAGDIIGANIDASSNGTWIRFTLEVQ